MHKDSYGTFCLTHKDLQIEHNVGSEPLALFYKNKNKRHIYDNFSVSSMKQKCTYSHIPKITKYLVLYSTIIVAVVYA